MKNRTMENSVQLHRHRFVHAAVVFGIYLSSASQPGQRLTSQKQAGHMNASNRSQNLKTEIASKGPSTYVLW